PFQARWLSRGEGRKLAVGPYVLVDRIGTGGMGEVFLARHRRLHRRAAVKIARPVQAGNDRARARVLQAVWAAARFDHPHAFRAAGDSGLTVTGRLLGSVDFTAPEQVEDARRAGPPADQYALGATLYYLLSGELPFPHGGKIERALARMTADPTPVQVLRPG